MKRILVLLLVMMMVLAGCGTTTPDTPDTEKTEWQASSPETRDLTALLTGADVSTAVGTKVADGQVMEDGKMLTFFSADYQTQVSLMLDEPAVAAADYLAALVKEYDAGTLVEAPNLGDAAYWCAETGELLVCHDKYVLSLTEVHPTATADQMLISLRQLAALVIERVEK